MAQRRRGGGGGACSSFTVNTPRSKGSYRDEEKEGTKTKNINIGFVESGIKVVRNSKYPRNIVVFNPGGIISKKSAKVDMRRKSSSYICVSPVLRAVE